jgi:hypothetical protein
MNGNKLIITSIIIALAVIISALIISLTWKSNYASNQTISVTGSAQEDIVSDLAILKGTLTARAPTAKEAYQRLEGQKPLLLSYLNSRGFGKDEVEFSTINSYAEYEITQSGRPTQNIKGYVYNQNLQVQSNDVKKIKEISIDISSLIEKGVDFSVQMPEYFYTRLADLKVKIQAEAAKDAMVRAEKIAEATGRSLGPMRSARMGVLQITPRYSNEVSALGMNDLSSIDKEITAVVSASFEIE